MEVNFLLYIFKYKNQKFVAWKKISINKLDI